MTASEADPHAPSVWSFSMLRDARECPRRWALRAGGRALEAHTPGAGGATPGMGLVRGRVCHAVLERMLDAHREHEGPAWGAPALQAFWKRHFSRGIVGLVREEAGRQLRRGVGQRDPAAEARLRREVDEAVPSLAASVGALLRLTLSRASGSEHPAAFAEVRVESEMAPGVRWRGRIDAVVRCGGEVTLIDFKTGAPSPQDVEQLTAYACLFERDERTRGWGSVRRLAVLYARGGVEERDAPTGDALDVERARLARETLDVARRLSNSPPEASPAPERCPRCDVRGRCDVYWGARAAWDSLPLRNAPTIDAELCVTEVLGGGRALLARDASSSWFVRLHPKHEEVARGLAEGSRVRLVGASPVTRAGLDDGLNADLIVDASDRSVILSGA
ncbi:RecB family exonuclease [Sorangium sp. So ce1024]|uniref:RecB family exonuclease n=1 Tax=Sorangium sp. So ce1024 TaxID=3133327 RepID=UPI003F01966A